MSDTREFKIIQLYRECSNALENRKERRLGDLIVKRYNKLLDELKEDHTSNQEIQGIQHAEEIPPSLPPDLLSPVERQQRKLPHEILSEIKWDLETIAIELGVNLPNNDIEPEQPGNQEQSQESTPQSQQQPIKNTVVFNNEQIQQNQKDDDGGGGILTRAVKWAAERVV